jgi:TatA/E family protein of Tat protein translocase
MFGLGMGELLVILAIALIVLGPKKLPDLATSLGKAIRSFRKATNDLTSQLEIDDEVKQPLRELKAALRDEPAPYVPPAVVDARPVPAATVAPPVSDVPSVSQAPGVRPVSDLPPKPQKG